MSGPGRTFKDQNARRRKLGKKNPQKALAEHKKRQQRRKAKANR